MEGEGKAKLRSLRAGELGETSDLATTRPSRFLVEPAVILLLGTRSLLRLGA